MSESTPSHHLAAVWFADLVGYSALSETNEGEAIRTVARFQSVVQAVVETHGGRVVKFLGDGALAEFPSTEQAVRSADTLRTDLARVAEAEGLGVKELRIGIHVGDVAEAGDGDLYGDGVNVASRIQSMADPGEVWVSEDVRRQLRQRPELRFASRGMHALKGSHPRSLPGRPALPRARAEPESRAAVTTPRG